MVIDMNGNKPLDVIAERTLMMGAENVRVIISKPQLSGDGEDYVCYYSIDCAGHNKISYAVGMDAIQSLQLAMKKIGADLEQIANIQGTPISWLADMPGDTGFL